MHDPPAEEIVASIDYDFPRFDGLLNLVGSVLRTALFDQRVSEFLSLNTRPARSWRSAPA